VTPRNLTDRLDALAGASTQTIDHTETDAPAADPGASQAAAEAPPSSAPAAADLLTEARREATNGRDAFNRWFRTLDPREADTLPVRELLAMADAADADADMPANLETKAMRRAWR